MAIWPKGRVALMLSLCLLLVTIAETVIAFRRYAKAEESFALVQIRTPYHLSSEGWEKRTITR